MPNEPLRRTEESFEELKRHSEDLKRRIEEQKRKSAMPINPALGDPKIDADNADGHNDIRDQDDD